MSIDAVGNLHSNTNGQFTGRARNETDPDLVLGSTHPMATLTAADFLTDDELEFARETLGRDATDDQVEQLAEQRANIAYAEYVAELDTRSPTAHAAGFAAEDWAHTPWSQTSDPDVVQLDGPDGQVASITDDWEEDQFRWSVLDGNQLRPVGAGVAASADEAKRAAQAAWTQANHRRQNHTNLAAEARFTIGQRSNPWHGGA